MGPRHLDLLAAEIFSSATLTDLNNKINCKLTLCEILELIYYFVKDLSFDLTEEMTGRSRTTTCDWFNMCREVCSSIMFVNRRGQMVG